MATELPEPAQTPGVDESTTAKLLFLQERMVNFTQQYSMPIVEVSLVVAKYTNQLSSHLAAHAAEQNEQLPDNLSAPWPLTSGVDDPTNEADPISGFGLDKVLDMVDAERMDIFDTIIRNVINESELPLADSLLFLRQWEHLVRSQLAEASGPGSLFSPVDYPEDF